MEIEYNIIQTGSKGNCIILNKMIALDIGISFCKLIPYIKDIALVFISHIHTDHFNKSTIKRLSEDKPLIRFCGCEEVAKQAVSIVGEKRFDLIKHGKTYDYKLFTIEPVLLVHDVQNIGLKIKIGNKKIFYATDTGQIEHIEAKDYDLYLIEGNYKKDELEEKISKKQTMGDFMYEYRVKKNHLSEEDAIRWIYKNAGNQSKYKLIHKHI